MSPSAWRRLLRLPSSRADLSRCGGALRRGLLLASLAYLSLLTVLAGPAAAQDVPTVAHYFSELIMYEGRTRTFDLPVALKPRPLSEFTLNYSVGGTATPGSDYTIPGLNSVDRTGMVTVPAGAGSAYIPVTIINDSDLEGDETIELTLTGGSGYRLGGRVTLPVTIVDNERVPRVRILGMAVRRPESWGKYRIPVRLSPPPRETITLDYTVSGTATPGLDYTIPGLNYADRTGTLSVPAGTAETYIPVTIIDDSVEDDGEILKLHLTPSPHYKSGRTKALYLDFDFYLYISNHEANDLEGEVQARLDAAMADGDGASANLWRRALAAVRGEAPPNGLARLTQAEAQAQVTAHLGSDIELAALWSAIAEVIGGGVTDPPPAADPEVTIAAGDGVTEGGSASFTLTATPAPAAPLDVAVTVAVEGDYGITAGTQTVTIPTTGSATLTLTTDDDEADEADGSVSVTVDAGAGYTVGSASSGTVAVADDDAPAAELAVTVALAAEGASVAEDNGEVKFTVTLSRALAAGETAVVPLTVTGGRAYRHWNIRFRPRDNGPGVKRTAVERDSAVTFTEGGRVATLVLIARPNLDTEQRTIRIAFGTGEHAPAATGVAGGLAPTGGAIEVAIVDDDAAAAPVLFVEDARARESAGAMRFAVRLTAPAQEVVRVRARTRDARPVSARAGRDYERTRVELRFLPGETRKHVRVALFDDGHDEGKETFELVLSNAQGAAIADRVAVGTIKNDDPLPGAWLARFGRVVAERALDGIAARMAAPRLPGMQGSIAGRALDFAPAASDGADLSPGSGAGTGFSQEAQSRGMTMQEVLRGSSFSLTGEADSSGGTLAFWGGTPGSGGGLVSGSQFSGHQRGDGTAVGLHGETATALLGTDYARGRWLVGFALSETRAEGGYVPIDGDAEASGGAVEASLAATIPYAVLAVSERLRLWGATGQGVGDVTVRTGRGDSLRADTAWSMAAAGLRGDLLAAAPPGSGSGSGSGTGPSLALVSDAMWVRTSSEKTRGLAASESDVTRLRLGLEGSWGLALSGGGSVTPTLEFGARHDGGGAETGFGVELGGGLTWRDPKLGLRLDLSGRTLVAHDDGALEDRGVSAQLAWDPEPASGRGLSLSLGHGWGGQARGGLDALFQPEPLEDRGESSSEAVSHWSMEAAWGMPVLGNRFTGSPYMGLGLAAGGRDYSLGWRLAPEAAGAPNLSFGLKATKRESDTRAPEHTVGIEASLRW